MLDNKQRDPYGPAFETKWRQQGHPLATNNGVFVIEVRRIPFKKIWEARTKKPKKKGRGYITRQGQNRDAAYGNLQNFLARGKTE